MVVQGLQAEVARMSQLVCTSALACNQDIADKRGNNKVVLAWWVSFLLWMGSQGHHTMDSRYAVHSRTTS